MTITKSVQLSAQSTTDAGEAIAYFSANISVNGTSSNMNIQNQALYDANKARVRQDKSDFDNAVYTVEDEEASSDNA